MALNSFASCSNCCRYPLDLYVGDPTQALREDLIGSAQAEVFTAVKFKIRITLGTRDIELGVPVTLSLLEGLRQTDLAHLNPPHLLNNNDIHEPNKEG